MTSSNDTAPKYTRAELDAYARALGVEATDSNEALARRIVACPHFRWLPDMRAIDVDGDAGVVVHVDGQRLRLSYGCMNSGRGLADLCAWQVAGECAPDLEGPATLGCIEHGLLPEAWPGCDIQTHWSGRHGSVYIHDSECVEVFAIEMVPKAEALVAALEAAPRESGR